MDWRFGLPFAISSAGGAAIMSVTTRWWTYGSLHSPYISLSGAFAIVVASACGALVGRIYERWLVTPDLNTGVAFGSMLMATSGALGGALVVAPVDPSQIFESASAGLALAILVMPLLFGAAVYVRRSERSRSGSIVGGSDRRAIWRLTTTWLAVASAVGVSSAGNEYFAHDRDVLSFVAFAVAFVAWVIASVVVTLDGIAHYTLQRSRRAPWKIDPLRKAPVGTLDVGVGDATWVERSSGSETYREVLVERVTLLGDAETGSPIARSAFIRSILAVTVASLAMMFALNAWIFPAT